MAINRDWRFPELKKAFLREFDILPKLVGNAGKNWFLVSLTKLNRFNDRPARNWKKRKNNKDPGRKLLVLTSRLKRGIQFKAIPNGVQIFNDVPYAPTHNFGLVVTPKVGKPFKMPKRQFMGESKLLNKRIFKLIVARSKAIVKRIKAL